MMTFGKDTMKRLEEVLGFELNRPEDKAFAEWFERRTPDSLETVRFILRGIEKYQPVPKEKRKDMAVLQCYIGIVTKETVGVDRSLRYFKTAKRNNPQVHNAIHNLFYGAREGIENLATKYDPKRNGYIPNRPRVGTGIRALI